MLGYYRASSRILRFLWPDLYRNTPGPNYVDGDVSVVLLAVVLALVLLLAVAFAANRLIVGVLIVGVLIVGVLLGFRLPTVASSFPHLKMFGQGYDNPYSMGGLVPQSPEQFDFPEVQQANFGVCVACAVVAVHRQLLHEVLLLVVGTHVLLLVVGTQALVAAARFENGPWLHFANLPMRHLLVSVQLPSSLLASGVILA